MVDYNVVLQFDNKDIRNLSEQGYKVCFAIGVEGSGDPFTVIAFCENVYPGLRISWSDRYSMAATRDEHMSGVRFSMAVNESDIRLKQKYTLPNGWRNGEVEDDGSLGAGSLSFRNGGGDEASAILLQRIQGRATPIYISGRPVSGGGTQTLTPTQEIAVWVDRNAETGTMISRNSGSQATFNMAGRSNLEAKWTGSRFEAQ